MCCCCAARDVTQIPPGPEADTSVADDTPVGSDDAEIEQENKEEGGGDDLDSDLDSRVTTAKAVGRSAVRAYNEYCEQQPYPSGNGHQLHGLDAFGSILD